MELEEFIKQLDALQAPKNDGRGVSCIKTVLQYLRMGMITEAKACCYNEGDKIANYPDIEEFLNLGIQHIPRYKR